MVDASLAISITSLIISFTMAIVGLILTVINLQRTFDPLIVLGGFSNKKSSSRLCVKNLGRGTAFFIRVNIYDDKGVMYRAFPIDILQPGEVEGIPGDIYSYPDGKSSDMYELDRDNKALLFYIKYNNENERKKKSLFLLENIAQVMFYSSKISSREFRKLIKKREKKV